MKLSDELRGLANRLSELRRTNHPENSRIYAMVAKAVTLENDNAAIRKRLRGARIIIEGSGQRDDWQERADEWLAAAAEGEADIARAKAEASHSMSVEDDLLTAQDDNAALRERLIEAGEAMRQALSDLEWVERQSPGSNFQASILLLRKRIASLPESISLSPDGPTDHLGETEDKP